MKKLIPLFLALRCATWGFTQNCPQILSCQQGIQVFCDFSGNDTLLWNAAPATFSPDHQSPDLYEGVATLSLNVLGCKSAGPLKIAFKLFLDLNQDNLEETVISSDQLPQSGYFLYNNAFELNGPGGTPYFFDRRTVTDSLRYSFDLQIKEQGDTSIASIIWHNLAFPNATITPRLPEGKHRIEWTVEQGGQSTSCGYLIRIRDCSAPLVFCKNSISASINPDNALAEIPVSTLLDYVSDNVTPNALLDYGIRRANTGIGFPVDSNGVAQSTLKLGCAFNGSTQIAEVWVKDKAGNTSTCETVVAVEAGSVACVLDPPKICAVPYNNKDAMMDGVQYRLIWTEADSMEHYYQMPNINPACSELDSFPESDYFSIEPFKDTYPLNGISTYDLVLMSRHILNIQPLDAAWKIIAADVNRSGSVTNFDVVETRKLLLGLNDRFPNSPSWRFYAAYCQFPPNPFDGWCPWVLTLDYLPKENYASSYYFYGLKVGDVNGNAQLVDSLVNKELETRAEQVLQCPDTLLEAGAEATVPFYVRGGAEWLGCQMEISYNPEQVEIESLKPGMMGRLSPDQMALPTQGRFALSWSDALPLILTPEDALFSLRIRAKHAFRLSEVFNINEDRLKAESYNVQGEAIKLLLDFDSKETARSSHTIWPPQPNPTSAGTHFTVQMKKEDSLVLQVYDLQGKIKYEFRQVLPAGNHLLEIPENALQTSGLYGWTITTGDVKNSGKLIRL